MPFYLKNSKSNIFIFKIKNNFTTIWNKMKHDATVFLHGYIFCAHINYNSLGWVIIPPIHQFFDDHNSVRLKKQRPRSLYAYDHSLKFSILQENPSLKQTETPNC